MVGAGEGKKAGGGGGVWVLGMRGAGHGF
jgi:hypothetical protein